MPSLQDKLLSAEMDAKKHMSKNDMPSALDTLYSSFPSPGSDYQEFLGVMAQAAKKRFLVIFERVILLFMKESNKFFAELIVNSKLDVASGILFRCLQISDPDKFLPALFDNEAPPTKNAIIKLRITTFCNLGCLEKRKGNMTQSQQYYSAAQELCRANGESSPTLLINLCSNSLLNARNDEAFYFGKAVAAPCLTTTSKTKVVEQPSPRRDRPPKQETVTVNVQEIVAVVTGFPGLLAVALYYMSVACHRLGRSEESNEYINLAKEAALKEVGKDSAIYKMVLGKDPEGGAEGENMLMKSTDSAEVCVVSSTNTTMPSATTLRRTTSPFTSSPLEPRPPAGGFDTSINRKKSTRLGRRRSVGEREKEEKTMDEMMSHLTNKLKDLIKGEDNFELQYQAAVKIQHMMLRRWSREIRKKLMETRVTKIRRQVYKEEHSAKIIIAFLQFIIRQKKQRLEERRKLVEQRAKRGNAVVKIQSVVRRFLAQLYVHRLRLYLRRYHQSVLDLQCWIRKMLAKLRYSSMCKSYKENMQKERRSELAHRSCRIIQSVYRKHRDMISVLMLKGDEKAAREMDFYKWRTHAAVRIQRSWKGYNVRKHTNGILGYRKNKRLITDRTMRRKRCATAIQAAFRGYVTRREHPGVKIHCAAVQAEKRAWTQEIAAIALQCFARKFHAKREFRRRKIDAEIEAEKKKHKVYAEFVLPADLHLFRRERLL